MPGDTRFNPVYTATAQVVKLTDHQRRIKIGYSRARQVRRPGRRHAMPPVWVEEEVST